jgi:hypothetical protein
MNRCVRGAGCSLKPAHVEHVCNFDGDIEDATIQMPYVLFQVALRVDARGESSPRHLATLRHRHWTVSLSVSQRYDRPRTDQMVDGRPHLGLMLQERSRLERLCQPDRSRLTARAIAASSESSRH